MSLRLHHIISCTFGLALSLAIAGSAAAQGQGRVVGEVTDDEGNPLAGVQITATNPNANPSEFTTTSGDDGNFAIIGLVSGQWMFRADCSGACGEANGSPRGYGPSEGPSNITQTRNPPIDFELVRIRHPLAQMLGDEAVAGIDLDAVDARITAADGAFNSGDYQQAIAGYEAVLGQLPALSNLHFNIGNAYAQMQDHEAAIAAYERALADDPQNQTVQVARARARLANGTADATDQQVLEQAATSLSASREDLYNQGEQAFSQGDIDNAAQWYERATMVDPNWAKPLFKLALVALNKGDMDTAKEYFQRTIDANDPTSEAETAQAQATLNALP
jgi:tetratricopeptide (TPR) repeat protein